MLNEKGQILGGGTVNQVFFDHSTGVVTKSFRTGNGISIHAGQRLTAEVFALSSIPIAPVFLGRNCTSVYMSHLDGEKHLDSAVAVESESTRVNVYQTAGATLSQIHNCCRQPIPSGHFLGHLSAAVKNLDAAAPRLSQYGINTLDVIDYLHNHHARVTQEVNRHGLTWTHGDFWLNNLIGQLKNGVFRLNGVIDWELGKVDTPYVDFAIALLSVEMPHPESSQHLWKSYGLTPDVRTKNFFAVMKVLDWVAADPHSGLESDFYQPKIDFIRQEIKK